MSDAGSGSGSGAGSGDSSGCGSGAGNGYEWIEHTSEITVRLRAPTFEKLFEVAARAFRDLVPEHLDPAAGRDGTSRADPRDVPSASGAWRRITLDGGDEPAVLVDWLNELVYLAEAELWVPTEIAVETAAGGTGGESPEGAGTVPERPRTGGTARGDRGPGAGRGSGPVTVRARGRTLRRPFVLVKAATLHGAKVRPADGHLEAEITLDI